jgi:hypothetical protein
LLVVCFYISFFLFFIYRAKAILDDSDGILEEYLSQMSIPDALDQTPGEIISEVERRDSIKEKYQYICIAFDGDHPQIAATERHLIPRSIEKNQDLVFVKWAGGCSMTQSPNDNNRGMHPVLKKIYGDSKFRYDSIADPPGEKWATLKKYLMDRMEPASFKTVWKALSYAPSTLQNACKQSSIRSAYHNTGIVDQNQLREMQSGAEVNPSNPRTILGVNPHFNNFSKEDGDYLLSKIDQFAEITSMYGYIPEDDYAGVLMGKTYLDNCPLLKPGAKPLNDMVTNRQRNLVMSNKAFVDQSRARAENTKMAMEDKESREIESKVSRPEEKRIKEAKKKEEKKKKGEDMAEAKRTKEEAKKEGKNEKNEMKRRREEEKKSNKCSKKNIPLSHT